MRGLSTRQWMSRRWGYTTTMTIKRPMDLGTMKSKLEGGKYSTAAEFADDMRLMLQNCLVYNPPEHDVVAMAKKLKQVFENRFRDCPTEKKASTPDSNSSATRGEPLAEHRCPHCITWQFCDLCQFYVMSPCPFLYFCSIPQYP